MSTVQSYALYPAGRHFASKKLAINEHKIDIIFVDIEVSLSSVC